MVVYHPEITVLLWSSGTVATYPVFLKKTATICLEVFRGRLISKHPHTRLLLNCRLLCVNERFVTCHDVIDVFWKIAILFFNISFEQSTRAWTNFYREMFLQYWMYASSINPCSYFNLTIGSILQYQFWHSISSFWNNNWFWATFTKLVLEWSTILIEFTAPSITIGPWSSFIVKICI